MRPPAPKFCTLVAAIAASIACTRIACVLAQGTPPAAKAADAKASGAATPIAAATTGAKAQTPTYADESVVIEQGDSDYTFAADGTGWQDRTIVARVQSDAAVRALGVVSVAYAGNSQTVEFAYARVRHPDGTVVETPVADVIDMPQQVTREAPFYSDLKEKQLPIRNLRVGDRLEWKARITTTKAQAPGEFWGQETFVEDTVVLAETIELRVPAGMAVNVWSPTAKAVETNEGGLHVYRWTSSQLKPMAGKEAETAAEAKKKLVWTAEQELDAEQGKLPTIAWTTFKSWDEVGAWYRGLEADQATPNAEIQAKVAELTAGKTTDEEKVRALYAYVATQIRYIGVAFGVGRYQPHTAAEVLSNQYGDCKDKHTLLAAMLRAAGIQADAVLIGAGIRFNAAVPSPAAFNHLITHLTVSGQPVWLDTTAEIAPYRMLISVIRDRQGLVVPNSGAARIEKTPADPPFASFNSWKAVGSLDKDGVSTSRITYSTRGDEELLIRAALHQVAPAQYSVVIQSVSEAMGYQGTASHPEFSSPENTVEPLTWSYDYRREQGGDWENYKIIPQTKYNTLPLMDDKNPPVQTIDLGWPRTETSTSEMKIPEGWGAVLPEAVHAKSDFATLDETYRFEKGVVYADQRVVILKEKVPASQWKVYDAWAKDAGLTQQVYVQLVRHDADGGTSSAASAGTGAAASTADGAEALKLIQQAYQDLVKRDLASAKSELEQAQKLSPDHEWYWTTMGGLDFRYGEITKSLEDYKKELALYPAAFQRVYPAILDVQLALGQRKDAEDSLRAWSKSDPVAPYPVARLLAMLMEDGDAKTAVAEGEAALQRLPAEGETDSVHLALGKAYLLAGDKQKGAAILKALLDESHDAEMLNNAAYELGDAGLELPLAESSTRKALEKLTEESNSWTLDEDVQTLRAKTRVIAATWDTLGWILFHEGKLEEAQSYLQAGWQGELNLTTGKHLGDVQAARGNKAAAITTYELAIASDPGYNALGVRIEPSAAHKALQAKVDTMHAGGVKSSMASVGLRLQELRKVQLGPSNGRSSNAEYRMLLKGGKAVKAEPTGDKTVAGADEMVARANFASFFPVGSEMSLVKVGYVNCHQAVCELMLQ